MSLLSDMNGTEPYQHAVSNSRLRDVVNSFHNIDPIRNIAEFCSGSSGPRVINERIQVVAQSKCN